MPRNASRFSLVAGALALALSLAVPAVACASSVTRVEDDAFGLSFTGAWTSEWSPSASRESVRLAHGAGARVTATFTGDTASVVGRRGPGMGLLRISVDGVAVADVDCYSATTSEQALLWTSAPLVQGDHTVTVESLGTSSPSATGTAVAFDAFDIAGSLIDAPTTGTGIADGSSKLAKTGHWWISKRAGAIGKRGWRTKSKGATVIARFDGTGITWFGLKDRDGGMADVYLDGKKVATVGQYADAAREQSITYAVSGLASGSHALTIRALGTAGSGGGKKIDVDGFLVDGTPLKAYAPSPFHYPWKRYIVIDKSEFRLYWVKNGMLIKTYPVALGRVGMTTPSRVWRVGMKYKTDPRGVYGPRKMRLFKRAGRRYIFTRYGIHGTNQQWVIGTRASHGCIRMYNKDVRELWSQVPVGTMVVTRD